MTGVSKAPGACSLRVHREGKPNGLLDCCARMDEAEYDPVGEGIARRDIAGWMDKATVSPQMAA